MSGSGWRDADGRTASERRSMRGAEGRTRFFERVRRRPFSLVKPTLMLAFAALLIFALLSRYL